MTETPKTQKVWHVTKRGEPAMVLKFTDAPVPAKLAPDEVLVKVRAAALNPVGYKLMKLVPGFLAHLPYVPEMDLAGIVVDGNGTKFKGGDVVFGHIESPAKTGGALEQYVRVPASTFAAQPPNVKPTEAAGLAVVGLTAYQALFGVAKLQPGQHVFVNGGTTSVGMMAIQLAKAIGCTVTASASGKNGQFVRDLGADEFVDYTAGPLHETLIKLAPNPKYDVLFETVGLADPALFAHSEAYLEPGGVFVSVGPQPSGAGELLRFAWGVFLKPGVLGGARRKWKMIQVKSNEDDLKQLTQYVAEGKVKPVVDSVYSFDDVLSAYEKLMTHRAKGKIVVRIDPDAE